jgi:hypothetical protein
MNGWAKNIRVRRRLANACLKDIRTPLGLMHGCMKDIPTLSWQQNLVRKL